MPDTGMYRNIVARAEQGDYTMVVPMDYQILGHLHDEGTTFANAYMIGHTAQQISRDLFGGQVKPQVIGPRMHSLIEQKLVISVVVPGNYGKNSYQRTLLGKQVYEEWSRANGTSPQDSSAAES